MPGSSRGPRGAGRPLSPIMLVAPPCEILFDASFWDELKDSGCEEVALWRVSVLERPGQKPTAYPMVPEEHQRVLAAVGGKPIEATPVPPFDPLPELYKGLPWQAPGVPSHLKTEAARLKDALSTGVGKGFKLYFADDKSNFIGLPSARLNLNAGHLCDPQLPLFTAARAVDTLRWFPGFTGLITDGQNYRWEIKPGHPDDIFAEPLDFPNTRNFCDANGLSIRRVLDGRDRFQERLHTLTPAPVRDFAANRQGAFGFAEWWAEAPDMLEWALFKLLSVEDTIARTFRAVKAKAPGLQVGVSARMSAIATISGHNARHVQQWADFQLPKEYWWHGGVAGMRGTASAWVETLMDWNRGLSEDEASSWFAAAFDYRVTSGYPVSKYATEAPDEFFDVTVRDQTRKMIAGCGGPERFVPWVSQEHGGKWVSPSEMRRLLQVMSEEGATRYCFSMFNRVNPQVREVIREFALA